MALAVRAGQRRRPRGSGGSPLRSPELLAGVLQMVLPVVEHAPEATHRRLAVGAAVQRFDGPLRNALPLARIRGGVEDGLGVVGLLLSDHQLQIAQVGVVGIAALGGQVVDQQAQEPSTLLE